MTRYSSQCRSAKCHSASCHGAMASIQRWKNLTVDKFPPRDVIIGSAWRVAIIYLLPCLSNQSSTYPRDVIIISIQHNGTTIRCHHCLHVKHECPPLLGSDALSIFMWRIQNHNGTSSKGKAISISRWWNYGMPLSYRKMPTVLLCDNITTSMWCQLRCHVMPSMLLCEASMSSPDKQWHLKQLHVTHSELQWNIIKR